MGAGASTSMGMVPGLWTCCGHGEEPGLCCARQHPGFRFGSTEAAVVSRAGRMLHNHPVTLPPQNAPRREANGVGTDPGGSWLQLTQAGCRFRGEAALAFPRQAASVPLIPMKPEGAWGRSSVQNSVLAGSGDMGVGFPWLQQHCSCRMPSRTLTVVLKSDQLLQE